MGLKACSSCNSGCGNGVSTAKGNSKVKAALCETFCKVRQEFCRGKHKGRRKSTVAAEEVKKNGNLKKALGNKKAFAEKMRAVPYDGKLKGRAPMSADQLAKHLKPMRDKMIAKVKRKLGEKAIKKASTAWMKFVPVLNVLSTAYDVYDFATTGYDLYKMVDQAMSKFEGNVYRAIPDVSIEGPNGQLKEIYDFKFDGDRWRSGQEELYNKALKDSGVKRPDVKGDGTIDQNSCKCDGRAKPLKLG